MKWRYIKEKFVITKSSGASMAFTNEELEMLKKIVHNIESGEKKYETKDNRNLKKGL